MSLLWADQIIVNLKYFWERSDISSKPNPSLSVRHFREQIIIHILTQSTACVHAAAAQCHDNMCNSCYTCVVFTFVAIDRIYGGYDLLSPILLTTVLKAGPGWHPIGWAHSFYLGMGPLGSTEQPFQVDMGPNLEWRKKSCTKKELNWIGIMVSHGN